MKRNIPIALLLCWVTLASAQERLVEFDWKQLTAQQPVSHAAAVSLDGLSALRIENTNDAPLNVTLLIVEKPPISNLTYAVTGRLKYEDVHGDGYLEMWNYFPPLKPGLTEGQYFSRTLGTSGPMGKISGTSDWREFLLPFDRTGASGPPTRLKLNLVLPGRGTVYVGPCTLVQYTGSAGGSAGTPAWWSTRQSDLIGGILGSLAGIFGGTIGALAGSGKARRFVLVTQKIVIVLGWILATFGILAVAKAQPYHVWYPLLLSGGLAVAIFWALLPVTRRRYHDLELRRMAAVDAS